jgi:hypothetical protein
MSTIRRYKKSLPDINLANLVGQSVVVSHDAENVVDVTFDETEYDGIQFALDEIMGKKGYDLDLDASGIDSTGAVTLASIKERWFFQIDRRTGELISNGYAFGGKQFSLSPSAQASLLGVMAVINSAVLLPMLTFPVNWNTKDDLDFLAIPDAATFELFYITAVGTYRNWLDTGTALKDQVRAAATIAAVEAIVDPR